MAWTYSGDPKESQRDELRFILQDTDTGLQLLQDEELDYLVDEWLSKYDSLTYVASVAAAVISRKFVSIVSVSADGVSVNTADLSSRYRELSVQLRDEYKAGQVGAQIDIGNIMIGYGPDPSIKPLRFGVGLHDNPEVGLQDYGGWTYDPFSIADDLLARGMM